MGKIGRNDPCPCGSGKKYKKCCIDSRHSFNPPKQDNQSLLFKQYNSIDLIKVFAGLTLLPQNHGKNVRLEELTRKSIVNMNGRTNRIEVTKLQSYLNENYSFNALEDVATNLFTDLITFYGGDYIIFPGITDGGSYVLSNLLSAIYNYTGSDIPVQFKSNCKQISLFILNLSDLLAKKLGYKRYMSDLILENIISFPTDKSLRDLKSAVTFSESEMEQLLLDLSINPAVPNLFKLNLKDGDLKGKFMEESPLLDKPIIHYDGEYIIASPATLSYALVNCVMDQAKIFDCFTQVTKAYHDLIWNYTQLHLSQLGFSRIELSVAAEAEDFQIREGIYRFDDDKLAYVQYVTTNDARLQVRKQQIINRTLALPSFADHQFMDISLLSSMGRDFSFLYRKVDNSKSIGMPIHDFDTFVKMEEYQSFDLWKFISARDEKLRPTDTIAASFLDVFKVYQENGSSFYLSDDTPHVIPHIEPGYAKEFYQTAKLLSDEHSALRMTAAGKLIHIPIERKDKYAPIYYSKSDLGTELQFYIEGYEQPVWVSPVKDVNHVPRSSSSLYFEMTEAIAYWLWQCQEYIKNDIAILNLLPITFKFVFDEEDKFHNVERNLNRDPDFDNHFDVSLDGNNIIISIPHSIIPYLSAADNEGERVLLKHLLTGFNLLLAHKKLPVIEKDRLNYIVDQTAPLGPKKKIFFLDTSNNLLLDPTNIDKPRYIQNYDTNVILDSLVTGLGSLCPAEGPLNEKATKTKLTRDIVLKVLLPKLQSTISSYKNEFLLQRLISLNESLIQKREDLRIKTPTRIACFVSLEEQTQDLQERLSKLDRTTLAVRCLIEHLASEPATSNKIVSTTAIDELIAIMDAIIYWGSLGDQIEYDLFTIEMAILPSGRVGTERELLKAIFDPYHSSKSKENVSNALETFEQAFPSLNPIQGSDVPESLDRAYSEEFGISFTRICEFINDLGIIAYNQPTACVQLSKSELFAEINNYEHTFTQEEFNHALGYLCLINRGKVHNIPEGFDSIDISPWRFNRRLSLLRKPLVMVGNINENPNIYWGFRQLLSSRTYLYEQCTTNRLRVSENGPVQKVLGKLAQANGNRLVKEVFDEINKPNLIIDSNVNINPNSQLKNDTDIGDVDVLVIDQTKKVIYSLECKSMAPSRNIKEMVEEVSKLFGSNSKKGWIAKHVERDEWLKGNLKSIGTKYGLDVSNYKVKSFLITREDMLTPYLKTKPSPIPFITLYKLKEEGLSALEG